VGERREGWEKEERWEKGERGWEKGGEKMREKGDKGKKGEKGEREWEKGVEGERKEKRSGRRLRPVLPLIDSGTVFVFLESQMHITPLSFEN
jgi:hypothetical protein